ncbi:MAG TPA: hypothetical protein VFQ65_09245 [Kofleriaceae bacterium]|nr:hypothetical protein [Kofleriaceae bacterium]
MRFDRATHGRFARGDGQLDAAKLATWQTQHRLERTGTVTENTCLVAEGKPPLPGPTRPESGGPSVKFTDPPGASYPLGFPVPLTVQAIGDAGPAHLAVEVDGVSEPDVPFKIGANRRADLDLPVHPQHLGTSNVVVRGKIGNTEVETDPPQQITVVNNPFLVPPAPLDKIDPTLPPAPAKFRPPVDQAQAEIENRRNTELVVRFDHATHGYYAKPNGELDALAVAEFQAEQELPQRVGILDLSTVERAEQLRDTRLHPDVDPDDPARAFHGPAVDIEIKQPDSEPVDPRGGLAEVTARTRAHLDTEVDVALVEAPLGAEGPTVAIGRGGSTSGGDGRVYVPVGWSPVGLPLQNWGKVVATVTTPLGAAPVVEKPVSFKSTGDVEPVATDDPVKNAEPEIA